MYIGIISSLRMRPKGISYTSLVLKYSYKSLNELILIYHELCLLLDLFWPYPKFFKDDFKIIHILLLFVEA
jgi:hypothetical protein